MHLRALNRLLHKLVVNDAWCSLFCIMLKIGAFYYESCGTVRTVNIL